MKNPEEEEEQEAQSMEGRIEQYFERNERRFIKDDSEQ